MISERHKDIILNYIMTLTIIIITVSRKPQLLYLPRFYAEEGQSFFSFAYNNTFLNYLLSPMYGYYSLYNVLATSFATLFPLNIAPLITTYQALLIQIFTSFIVIWCDIPILDSNLKRYFVAISFPLLCPPQIWLTTIGVQYWLCVMTSLIYLEGPSSKIKPVHVSKAFTLILTGMTGILSCMMTPIFLIKWILGRSKQFLIYTCILGMCSMIQFCIFIQAYLRNDIGLSNRLVTHSNSVSLLYAQTVTFLGNFLAPMIPIPIPIINKLDMAIRYILFILFNKHGYYDEIEAVFTLGCIVIMLAIVPLIIKYIGNVDYMGIILSSMIIYFLSMKLSLNSTGGPRYYFAPSAMIMLFLIASYSKIILSRANRMFLAAVITVSLLVHVNYYSRMEKTYNDKWPKWEDEVRLWRIDNNHPLKIWPTPWEMKLQKPKI